MTDAGTATVHRVWEAWVEGNLERVFAEYDSEIVWDLSHYKEWPESRYHGLEGVRRFFDEWLELWDWYEAGLDELRLAPDGRVVALCWQRGKGRHSGLSMEMKWAQIYTVRNGKITQIDNYDNRPEALTDAGLAQ